MKSFKKTIINIFTACIVAIASLCFTINAHATASVCSQNVSDEIKAANGCSGYDIANIEDVVINVVNIVVGILGLVAVVFIVVGGVNYMTSMGDAGKVEKAKKTILYAVIGLVICALAFAIVNFVVADIIGNDVSPNTNVNVTP